MTKGIKAKKYYQRQGIPIGDNTFGTNQEDVVVIPTYDDEEEEYEDPFSDFNDWWFLNFKQLWMMKNVRDILSKIL